MAPFIPRSIRQESLKAYLNRTKKEHDGYGYNVFTKELGKGQNPTSLSKMFNVSRHTMYKWLKVHKAETKEAAAEKAIDSLSDV